jgi:hypothetical protein
MSAHNGVSSTSFAEGWRGASHIGWLVDGDTGGWKHGGGVLVDRGQLERATSYINGLIQSHVVGADRLHHYWRRGLVCLFFDFFDGRSD